MARLTLNAVQNFAKPRNIVVERIGLRYEATCNDSNTTAVCSNINELWGEVVSLADIKKDFELNFEDSVLKMIEPSV